MTREYRILLAKNIRMTAVFYGLEIAPERLTLILDYWESTSVAPQLICEAYKRFTEESKIQKFPAPADIMGILNPKADPHDLAVCTASKVIQAVSRFGYNNQEEAFAFIGPSGVDAVRRFGGWLYVCENLGVTIDVTTFQAQVREITKSDLRLNAIGSHRPSLNAPADHPREIESKQMADIMALVPRKEF